ncbi:MAG: DUF1800 family protein [Pirellulaceae bacterium]
MFRQNRLLRQHALGDFAMPHGHAVARDPAMLIYLDSATNRKAIQRKLLSRIDGAVLLGRRQLHRTRHSGTGSLLHRLGDSPTFVSLQSLSTRCGRQVDSRSHCPFPDSEAVDVVLDQPAATQFVVGKLFRFFVADEPAPTAALLQPLADDLREHNWDVRVVVRRMLSSQLFFSDIVRGRKVRSPVDLYPRFVAPLQGSTNTYQVAETSERLAKDCSSRPIVKGWDGGRTWINSASLLDRSNAVGSLLRNSKTRFGGENLGEYLTQQRLTRRDTKPTRRNAAGRAFARPLRPGC